MAKREHRRLLVHRDQEADHRAATLIIAEIAEDVDCLYAECEGLRLTEPLAHTLQMIIEGGRYGL